MTASGAGAASAGAPTAGAKVPAADQTLRILSLLAESRGPLPASRIAAQLDLPRSTVYQLLATLQQHGFVLHLPQERRYGLGMAAVELSFAYMRHEPLTRLGAPLIAALVDEVGLSAHLSVPSGRDVLYVIEQRARRARALVTDVHVRLPMPLTASGRAILAAMPRAQVRALFPDRDAFERRHGDARDVDRYSALRAILDETVTRGYAWEQDSISEGLSSVAVPVRDHRAWPVAAIAVTFENDAVAPDALAPLVDRLRQSADTLSARIHGTGTGTGAR
jgi:DNA-binding IclR family transcriptional regulator